MKNLQIGLSIIIGMIAVICICSYSKEPLKCPITDYALFLAGQKEIQIHFDTPKRPNITYIFKRVQNITNLFTLSIDGEKDGLLTLDSIRLFGTETIINVSNKWGYFEFSFDKKETLIGVVQHVYKNSYLNIEETHVTFELP